MMPDMALPTMRAATSSKVQTEAAHVLHVGSVVRFCIVACPAAGWRGNAAPVRDSPFGEFHRLAGSTGKARA
jgi:hypothetical protein